MITSLQAKQIKLLDLYDVDQISSIIFADKERRLTTQVATLDSKAVAVGLAPQCRDQAADEFEQVAELLTTMNIDAIWNEASRTERQSPVKDLVDSSHIYPDKPAVQVTGAPPIRVTLDEVGRRRSIKPVLLGPTCTI